MTKNQTAVLFDMRAPEFGTAACQVVRQLDQHANAGCGQISRPRYPCQLWEVLASVLSLG